MKKLVKESLETIKKWEQLGNCTDEDEMLVLMDELGINVEDDIYSYYEDILEGCKACGGPYPSCTTSCKLFDD